MAGETIGDVVRSEAVASGRVVADDQIEHIVWEFTGYPCFWPDSAKTPEENFRAQLREYFADPQGAHERRDHEEKAMLEAFRADGR